MKTGRTHTFITKNPCLYNVVSIFQRRIEGLQIFSQKTTVGHQFFVDNIATYRSHTINHTLLRFLVQMMLIKSYDTGADPENFSRWGPTLSKIDSVLRITVEMHKYEK